jgi:hypothetical protein
MALVCSARSKIWSVICVAGVSLALILMIGGALGWFESGPGQRGRLPILNGSPSIVSAGFGPSSDEYGDGDKARRGLSCHCHSVNCKLSSVKLYNA